MESTQKDLQILNDLLQEDPETGVTGLERNAALEKIEQLLAGSVPSMSFEFTYVFRRVLKTLRPDLFCWSQGAKLYCVEVPGSVLVPTSDLNGKSYYVNHGSGYWTKNTFIAGHNSVRTVDTRRPA